MTGSLGAGRKSAPNPELGALSWAVNGALKLYQTVAVLIVASRA